MKPGDVARAVVEAGARGVSCRRSPGCGHLHLDLRAMKELRFYQPGDLTVGADAGMTVAALDRALGAQGQFVPIEIEDPERTTLGAALACRLSGPMRQRYGTVRDFTIGMEMATAEGKLVHCGGRVVKNVAGYDWMKLMIGARGALGIITGVNFKVFPRPGEVETGRFEQLTWAQVEGLRTGLLHSQLRPLAIELEAQGDQRSVAVSFAGSEVVRARYRDELAKLGAGVSFISGGVAATPATNWSCPPAEAVARLRELGPEARIRGRLGLGVFAVEPMPGAAPVAAGTARLMAAMKRELDPRGVMHGGACG